MPAYRILKIFVCLFLITILQQSVNPHLLAQGSKDAALNREFEPYFAPNRIIIKFNTEFDLSSIRIENGIATTGISSLDNLSSSYRVKKIDQLFPGSENLPQAAEIGLPRIYRIEFPAGQDIQEIVAAFSQNPYVEYAQPVGIHRVYVTTPNDPSFSSQWGMTKIQAPQAWDISRGDTSIILAIVDTGVDWKHPDLGGGSPYLQGNIWTNWAEYNGTTGVDDDNNGFIDDVRGWDWVDVVSSPYPTWPGEDGLDEDNDPMDFNGHGTHCAGIANAITDNGTGVAGLGWGCKIMPLRVGWSADYIGNEVGLVSMDFCAQAIYYAARNGAAAINCSWGSSNTGGLADAVTFATSMGALVVSAAGNDNLPHASYLSSRHDCIAVAATDPNDNKASYSSFGFWVDIAAPGGDYPPTTDEIFSTYFDHNKGSHNYDWLYGTSMAAPHVVGLIGLIRAQFPGLDWRSLKERIQLTSDNIDLLNPGYKNGLLGAGRINAFSAVSQSNLPLMTTFFTENFDAGLPTSWTADPYWHDDDPGNKNSIYDDAVNPSGIKVGYDVWNPPFMIVDSQYEGKVAIDASLVTPIIDCSMYADIRLVFNNWFQNDFAGNIEKGDIDISIDSGPWQTAASFVSNTSYNIVNAGREIMIRLPSSVDYQNSVQIRWHYYDANDDMFWGIDEIKLIGNMIATDYYAQLTPAFQTSGGQAGDTISYVQTVKNIGLLSDSYDLSISGNSWATTLWDSTGIDPVTNTGMLASTEEFPITVKVEIPANAIIGDIDTATVTATSTNDPAVFAEAIALTAVKAPPDKIPWFDDFPTLAIDTTKWTSNTGPAEISTLGINPPSPPYCLNLNGDATGGDEVQSHAIDLSAETQVILSYYYQRTGGGESPDTGDDLFVDYYNATGVWENLKQYPGAELDMTIFTQDVVLLPADAYHNDFKIRFRNKATAGTYDDWFIDDVLMTLPADISVAHNPDPFDFTVDLGDSTSGSITISNSGSSDLKFWFSNNSSSKPPDIPIFLTGTMFDPRNVNGVQKIASIDENAQTAEGLYMPVINNNPGILATGDILRSWTTPEQISNPWGVGFDNVNIWLSDSDGLDDHKVTTLGRWLESFNLSSWIGSWPGDFAWDGKYIWQVNVGGDNGIYQLDPATGTVLSSIHDPNSVWDATSQRGLACDRETDVFYIGGWNHNSIYRIKGLSWDNPGEIIDSFPFLAVSGLGVHPSGSLWIATNALPDMIYQVNPNDGTILSEFAAPGSGDGYWGAGLELDNNGYLWVVCQDNKTIYQVDSGESLITWIKEIPRFGTVSPGDSASVTVMLYATDDTGLVPGLTYKATIHVTSNDPTPGDEDISIPVSLTVNPVDFYFRVDPAESNSKGKAGETLNYLLTIKNYGQLADSYNLSSTGNAWNTTFWDSTGTTQITNTGTVASKAEYDVIAKVEIPGNSQYGEVDTARVTISSAGKQDISKTVTLKSYSIGMPDAIPWVDDFPTTTLNPDKWIYNTGPAEINDVGLNEPSPPYSLNLNGDATGGDEIRSALIDLSNDSLVILSYQWERTGGGNSPETNDDLWVDYLNSSGAWKNLKQHSGSGPDDSTYAPEDILLPSDAYHNAFQVRFHCSGNSGSFKDDWFVDDVQVTYPPVVAVIPGSYQERVRAGEKISADPPMLIGNSGASVLRYNIISIPGNGSGGSLQFEPANRSYPGEYYLIAAEKEGTDPRIGAPVIFNAGGPDNHGYYWIDSDEPGGPEFNWIDISTIGTKISVIGDNNNVGFFPIGFFFPFYDNSYMMFRLCSNGFISFSSTSTYSYNQPIPNQNVFDLVAPFWDDLSFDANSSAYYYFDGQKSIIQYDNIEKDGTPERNSFEILLYQDGSMTFQYLTMQSTSNSATIGIQNNDGSDGLEIAFSTDYVHDSLAVHITQGVPWINLSRTNGIIESGSIDTVQVELTAENINQDTTLYANILVRSNDPIDSSLVIPVEFDVITSQTITGTIFSAGIPLESAVAQAWDSYPDGLIIDQDTTNTYGEYQLVVAAEGGVYTVRAFAKGYFPAYKENVAGNTANLKFNLKPVTAIIPTTKWVDFFSDNTKFWGGPVQVGDVVLAQDPDSVICGIFTVDKPAHYGFMPVYRDDDTTPDVDEGAQPGDTITFRINGYPAESRGPDSPVWSSHGGILNVDLFVKEIDTLKITLAAGWNLVSWNVDTPDDSTHIILKDILSNVIVVLGYEKSGLTYDPSLPSFSNLQIMDHLHGYWIKMERADTLIVVANPVEYQQAPIYCESGWNLVSYLPKKPDSTAHGFESVLDNTVRAYGFKNGAVTFDPTMPEFNTLNILCRTYGYWLYLTEDDTLIYPQPLPGIECPGNDPMLGRMVASAGHSRGSMPTNEWINVFGEGIKLDNELLPIGTKISAKDPQGVSCGEFVVSTPGKFGFMPIYRDDPNTDIDEGCQPGDEISIYFDDVEIPVKITWNHFGDVIDLGGVITSVAGNQPDLPADYNLSPNYPNPFNPETTIKFQLPEPGYVTLKIYNMLGQLVRTLVAEQKKAGYFQFTWDGQDNYGHFVANGIYLFRLKAGEFEKTRKMIMLK